MIAAALLLLAGGALFFLPEHLAAAGVGTLSALSLVAYGWSGALGWLVVCLLTWGRPASVVAVWLAFEAGQRPACRLLFPLTGKPPDGNLCEAYFGRSIGWVGLLVAAGVAVYVAERARRER